ncbi:hypothetical protein MMC24_001842 [Lignoscripta atroalba]|nr:hypothetical protein [Lignoscripta atroalba]
MVFEIETRLEARKPTTTPRTEQNIVGGRALHALNPIPIGEMRGLVSFRKRHLLLLPPNNLPLMQRIGSPPEYDTIPDHDDLTVEHAYEIKGNWLPLKPFTTERAAYLMLGALDTIAFHLALRFTYGC